MKLFSSYIKLNSTYFSTPPKKSWLVQTKVLFLLVSLAFPQPHVAGILGIGSEMLEREKYNYRNSLTNSEICCLDRTTNVLFIFQSHCYSFSGKRLRVHSKNIYFGKELPGQL